MPKAASDDVRGGMAAAEDVVDQEGDVVIPAGGVLSPGREGGGGGLSVAQRRLLSLARMFGGHRDDPLMCSLCRLAVKCAREGIVGG